MAAPPAEPVLLPPWPEVLCVSDNKQNLWHPADFVRSRRPQGETQLRGDNALPGHHTGKCKQFIIYIFRGFGFFFFGGGGSPQLSSIKPYIIFKKKCFFFLRGLCHQRLSFKGCRGSGEEGRGGMSGSLVGSLECYVYVIFFSFCVCCNDNAAVSLTCTISTLLSKQSRERVLSGHRPLLTQTVPSLWIQSRFNFIRKVADEGLWADLSQLCRQENFSRKSFSAQHVSYVSGARLLPKALLKVNRVPKDAATSDPRFPLQASAPRKLTQKLLIMPWIKRDPDVNNSIIRGCTSTSLQALPWGIEKLHVLLELSAW